MTVSWNTLRLETERLRLRPPTLQDVNALCPLFTDPEVMFGLGKEAVSAPEGARAIVEDGIGGWERDGVGPFVIETAAGTPQVVGQAGLMIFDMRGWTASSWSDAGSYAQAELGWALVRARWGHGYATEAAAAILEWGHHRRSLESVVSLISPENARSQRVARRLGAVPTETVTPVDSRRPAVVWRHALPGERD